MSLLLLLVFHHIFQLQKLYVLRYRLATTTRLLVAFPVTVHTQETSVVI